jgi:hypothetical protein
VTKVGAKGKTFFKEPAASELKKWMQQNNMPLLR